MGKVVATKNPKCKPFSKNWNRAPIKLLSFSTRDGSWASYDAGAEWDCWVDENVISFPTKRDKGTAGQAEITVYSSMEAC